MRSVAKSGGLRRRGIHNLLLFKFMLWFFKKRDLSDDEVRDRLDVVREALGLEQISKGLSDCELAASAGVGVLVVERFFEYESDRVRTASIRKLAKALGVRLCDIVENDGE